MPSSIWTNSHGGWQYASVSRTWLRTSTSSLITSVESQLEKRLGDYPGLDEHWPGFVVAAGLVENAGLADALLLAANAFPPRADVRRCHAFSAILLRAHRWRRPPLSRRRSGGVRIVLAIRC